MAGQLDLADDVRWSAAGPGLTFDEGLNIEGGVYYVESALRSGFAALHPGTYYDIFNNPAYHPDYPPLGRLPAALSNAILFRLLGGEGHPLYVVTYARVGSALVFGLLMTLVCAFTQQRVGVVAGLAAGVALWFTPRVFGHAHLASVETMMNLSYAGCVLLTLLWLAPRERLKATDGLVPGLLLGLALLTKIQAIFLPPVLAVWMLWNWRQRGIPALLVMAVTSFFVFLLGWPWLWGDPLSRFVQYFSQTTERVTLYCYYFGQRYADKMVPWHYPLVMFLTTTPVLFLVLGVWGMCRRGISPHLTHREHQLLLGAFSLPLIVFALPGVAVYDGERLFLIIWPIFAIWVGIATQQLMTISDQHWKRWGRIIVIALMLSPAVNIISISPCFLSYYNGLVGGLSGANRLGLEVTYWGDSLSPRFIKEMSEKLPQGAVVGIAPILHPLYLEGLKKDSWFRHRPDLRLIPYDDQQPDVPRYVFEIRRLADPWESLMTPPEGTEILGEVTKQSVPLARLMKLPGQSSDQTTIAP
ncbi:MAG TPA: hypothetical protein VNQ76_06525 [Planctomicrobium sp.]|nr:hypothetical protein [Planctomicrobium sp.]